MVSLSYYVSTEPGDRTRENERKIQRNRETGTERQKQRERSRETGDRDKNIEDGI